MKTKDYKQIDWEKEFDEKRWELVRWIPTSFEEESPIFEFGYKIVSNLEMFTITDWGNIKKFIRKTIDSERQKVLKEFEGIALELLEIVKHELKSTKTA